MIKILFFIERLSSGGSIGGAEKVLCNLVNHMDEREFDITVQTIFPDSASAMLSEKIRYKSLFKKQSKKNLFLYRLESALKLTYQMHLKGDYDIEAAYLEYGPTKVMAASTNKKAKKLAWIHCDFEAAIRNKEEFRKKSLPFYRAMDKIMCVSEKTREGFQTIFGTDFDTVVLQNVIDDEEIRNKAQKALPENVKKRRLTLLMVGRFQPQKNYMRLLKTVKQLRDEGFLFDLWIVGDGVEREKLEKYIEDNSLNETVTLWGFQKNPYPFMKNADLLVCSSNFEGYSTYITEGIILEKPILTTDCSGMRDLLGNSEYGIIVENSDEAFYNGLKFVLSDAEKQLDELKAKVSLRSGDFKMKKLVKGTEDFFRDLLTEKK